MEKRVMYHMPDRPTSKLRLKILDFGAALNVADDKTRHNYSSTWRKNLNKVVIPPLAFLYLLRNRSHHVWLIQ